jgi:lipoprotein
MNKIFCFLLIYIITLSCNIYNKKEFYTGYVYDFVTRKPLQNVKVIELESNHETTTNEKGYFSMKKLENVSSSLIFEKEGYRKDTIRSIQIQNGEQQQEVFKGKIIYISKLKEN